jgi:hypothetical protein
MINDSQTWLVEGTAVITKLRLCKKSIQSSLTIAAHQGMHSTLLDAHQTAITGN